MVNKRGFTLVELLVVIAIIGLLIAILLPVLGKVKLSVRQTQCLVNQRSLVQGAMTYAAENKGFFPWSVDPDNGHTADAYDLRSIYGENGSGQRRGRATYQGATNGRRAVGLGLIMENNMLPPGVLGDVYHCPAFDNSAIGGIGMDNTDASRFGVLGGSAWYDYPLHRIVGSFNYRGTSFAAANRREMTLDDMSPNFLMIMDTPDMRKRGFKSLYNEHGGYNYVTADGSGRHFADRDYTIDLLAQMAGTSGNVDGRRRGNNPITGETRQYNGEAIAEYITENN